MNSEIISQMQYFAIYILCGISIGILFDIFRILRKSFKTPDFVTYIEDVIFGIITGIFLIFIIFIFNNGELRFYIFLALLLGNVLYLSTISKYFIKINVKIITTLKNTIIKIFMIITFPIRKLLYLFKKYILSLILKPFKILTINAKNVFKTKKIKNFLHIKKDFKK